jgi:hypothetical protein
MLTILTLLVASLAAPQTRATEPDRWAIQTPSGPLPGRGTDCHPLAYFSDQQNLRNLNFTGAMIGPDAPGLTYDEFARSLSVGEIGGFAIYEVIFRVNEEYSFEMQPYATMKMILVERKRGEFCEIYNEQGPARTVKADDPVVIVQSGSEPILAAGETIRQYWTFDKDGPMPLDLGIIDDTVRTLLPPDRSLPATGRAYEGFDVAALSYSAAVSQPVDAPCCATGGTVSVWFALKNHQLSVVAKTFDRAPRRR